MGLAESNIRIADRHDEVHPFAFSGSCFQWQREGPAEAAERREQVRSLLQVTVEQADVTDDIFTKLMGEVVEPRREFIVDNALNVANLDV